MVPRIFLAGGLAVIVIFGGESQRPKASTLL
jgi:hypothetical protein